MATYEGFKISVERKGYGDLLQINATNSGGHSFHATFPPGDARARDAAIELLIEKICGFSKSTIFIAIDEFETKEKAHAG